MTTPEQFGTTIGMILVLIAIGYGIYLIWKYKPASIVAKMLLDLRYFFLQVVLMYSSRPSIFSIKRFHNGLITYWAIITASLFIRHKSDLSAEGFVIVLGPMLVLGGYNLYQTQQDKKLKLNITPEENDKPESTN